MKSKRQSLSVIFAMVLTLSMLLVAMPLAAFAYEDGCPHTSLTYIENETQEPTCFEPGLDGYWCCDECGQFLDKNKENAYWEEALASRIPAIGHAFNTDTGKCDNCSMPNPVYTKITSLSDVNEEDMYIVVARVGGRYFVLGGLDEGTSNNELGVIECMESGNAIEIIPNQDGSISLLNQNYIGNARPSEFMFDIAPDQFGSDLDDNFGLTLVLPKLENYCIYPFQSYCLSNTGYIGVPRYANEVYGMWDSSEWIIDFYTTEVDEDTYRDDMDGRTHAEQVARGNIGENISEGDLLMYKSSYYCVGGAMFTLRFREYVNLDGDTEYCFICGEDGFLVGSGEWDPITDKTPTNDVQYALSLYRYDVPAVESHTCDFGDWVDDENSETHSRTCTYPDCDKSETLPHTWGDFVKLNGTSHIKTCSGCNGTRTEAHTFGEWTSEGNGATERRECTVASCDAYETRTPHSCAFGEWMPDPNNDMKHIRLCACGASESGNHDYGDFTKKDDAYHTRSCSTCAATEDFEHSFYDWTAQDNNNHIHECMECDYTSVLPHDYEKEVTEEPTQTEEGEATYTCSLCSHFYTEELPKKIAQVTGGVVGTVLNVPEGSNAYIPEGTTFDVVEVPAEEVPEQVLGEIAVTAEGAPKALGMYDLALLLDGAEIQPDGTVAITIPAPDLAADYDKIIVVYIAPDGSYEECATAVNEDGTITFETTHFSRYAVIGIAENAGLGIGAIIGIVAGAVALLGGGFCLYLFFIRKKKLGAN